MGILVWCGSDLLAYRDIRFLSSASYEVTTPPQLAIFQNANIYINRKMKGGKRKKERRMKIEKGVNLCLCGFGHEANALKEIIR